jgi:hypothetical protein
VQGDTGPGNFLHDGHRVTAVLDFELAHLGDPMEDLAWIGTRNAQEPLPDYSRLLRQYEQLSGTPVDPVRLRYHMLFAELRIAVLYAERRAAGPQPGADLGNQLIYGTLHARLTVEALAAAAGIRLPGPALPAPAESSHTVYFDSVLSELREVIGPHIDDPFAVSRSKGVARVVKYLREVDRFGGLHREAELADLAQLLGTQPPSVEAAWASVDERVHAGALDAGALLPCAWRQVMRQQQLVGPAMGVLATRHLPDVSA